MIRWIYKGLIFFSLLGICNVLFEKECYFSAICCVSVITYMGYRLLNLIFDISFWNDAVSNPNTYSIGYDNYEYLNYAPNNGKHITVYGTKHKEFDIKDITDNIKLRKDKIEILETTTKEIIRPIVKVEEKDTFIKTSRRVVKKVSEEKVDNPTINPDEFNKDLIMLVNDSKLSKDVVSIYDCIIKALKECKYPSSMICTILQAFPYIDLCGKQVMIYINKRQIEGVVLSKIKRNIITHINEKFNNEIKTVFEEMKYFSVFDYFAKMNTV